jgi:diguanylate cyclase
MQHETTDLKNRLKASKVQIEKLHSTLAEAQAISLRDPLTQLHNRRGFDADLAQGIGQAQTLGTALCLVMGDIDNFKKVNDAFGHPIGDEILKIFASVLADTVQAAGSVARYGGEEFAVILPGIELEDAKQLTERMRLELEGKKLAVNKSGTEIGKITAPLALLSTASVRMPRSWCSAPMPSSARPSAPAQPGGCRRARGRILTAGTVGLNHGPGSSSPALG